MMHEGIRKLKKGSVVIVSKEVDGKSQTSWAVVLQKLRGKTKVFVINWKNDNEDMKSWETTLTHHILEGYLPFAKILY